MFHKFNHMVPKTVKCKVFLFHKILYPQDEEAKIHLRLHILCEDAPQKLLRSK